LPDIFRAVPVVIQRPVELPVPGDDGGTLDRGRTGMLHRMRPVDRRLIVPVVAAAVHDDVPFNARLIPVMVVREIPVVPIVVVPVHIRMEPYTVERAAIAGIRVVAAAAV
jgi:hypothetical protein